VNYYPEQLRGIAALCEALNSVADAETESKVAFKSRIPVIDADDVPERPIGYLVDEIGGAWSFEPVAAS